MFAVEVYAAVRHFVFIEGHSRREVVWVFELSRETVLMPVRAAAGRILCVPAAAELGTSSHHAR
jgi:hypothetical protein